MNLTDVISHFNLKYPYKSHEQLLSGHINETYLVTLKDNSKYIVQKMNNYVFKNIDNLMENIINVTSFMKQQYISKNLDYHKYVLEFIKSGDKYYYHDENNDYWRIYKYIDNSDTYYSANNLKILYETGKAFGSFQRNLSNFDASILHESIKDFHNTIKRYENLKLAAKKDVKNRFNEVKDLYNEFLKYEDLACKMTKMLQNGLLPLRVTHNDTKCNNVLIENDTNLGLAVIDLDTIMPGLAGFDFGDSIRSGTATASEHETNLELIKCDIDKFDAYAKGFLSVTKDSLTKNEIDTLVLASFNMTIEVGVRFLTDYLDGDVYFHTNYLKQNLDRAINQLAMAKDILAKKEILEDIIHRIVKQ